MINRAFSEVGGSRAVTFFVFLYGKCGLARMLARMLYEAQHAEKAVSELKIEARDI